MTSLKHLPTWRIVLATSAVFLSSMCTMGDLPLITVLNTVYETYADAPEALVNYGVTGVAMVSIPLCLVAGWLLDRFDKKWVLVGGFGLFAFSTIFGAAIQNVYYFVCMRQLFAIGYAFANTAAFSILAELFTNGAQRGKVIGWYNAFMALVGAVLSAVSGLLAVSSPLGEFQGAYQTYLLSVPVLVFLAVALPRLKPNAASKNEQAALNVESESIDEADAIGHEAGAQARKEIDAPASVSTVRIAGFILTTILVGTCYFVSQYMISLYVADAGIGNAAFTGSLTSAMTIATALSSLGFGFFYARFGGAVRIPAVFAIGAGFLAMGFFPSKLTALACITLMGFAWSFFYCHVFSRCAELLTPTRRGFSTSLATCAISFASMLSSYALTGLMGILDCSAVEAWPYFGIIMIGVSIVLLASSLAAPRR